MTQWKRLAKYLKYYYQHKDQDESGRARRAVLKASRVYMGGSGDGGADDGIPKVMVKMLKIVWTHEKTALLSQKQGEQDSSMSNLVVMLSIVKRWTLNSTGELLHSIIEQFMSELCFIVSHCLENEIRNYEEYLCYTFECMHAIVEGQNQFIKGADGSMKETYKSILQQIMKMLGKSFHNSCIYLQRTILLVASAVIKAGTKSETLDSCTFYASVGVSGTKRGSASLRKLVKSNPDDSQFEWRDWIQSINSRIGIRTLIRPLSIEVSEPSYSLVEWVTVDFDSIHFDNLQIDKISSDGRCFSIKFADIRECIGDSAAKVIRMSSDVFKDWKAMSTLSQRITISIDNTDEDYNVIIGKLRHANVDIIEKQKPEIRTESKPSNDQPKTIKNNSQRVTAPRQMSISHMETEKLVKSPKKLKAVLDSRESAQVFSEPPKNNKRMVMSDTWEMKRLNPLSKSMEQLEQSDETSESNEESQHTQQTITQKNNFPTKELIEMIQEQRSLLEKWENEWTKMLSVQTKQWKRMKNSQSNLENMISQIPQ